MSIKSDKVKSGYADLTDSEKLEVKNFIKAYDEASLFGKENLVAETRTFNKGLGPKNGNECPCCGKS